MRRSEDHLGSLQNRQLARKRHASSSGIENYRLLEGRNTDMPNPVTEAVKDRDRATVTAALEAQEARERDLDRAAAGDCFGSF